MSPKPGSKARLISVLSVSPVFGRLDPVALEELAAVLTTEHVAGGSLVLTEGDASDSMLFLISGRLRVSRKDAQGNALLYNEILPGESIGEVGLILHQPRTADVTAVRDSSFAVLNRADFEALLVREPVAMNRVFVEAVYNHLRHKVKHATTRQAHSFAVVPLHRDAETVEVARSLVRAFAKMGQVHHLRPPMSDPDQTVMHPRQTADDYYDLLEERFDYLIYESDADITEWTRKAFRQSDQVIYVVRAGEATDFSDFERALGDEPGSPMKRKHLVVLHPAKTLYPRPVSTWKLARDVERVYPMRHDNDADFSRLARFLTGNAIGVVLGGGGARGFAHLGVLRALHEAAIPVDLIGGNSMGALIGAQYACGVSLDDIREQTQAFATGGERLMLPLFAIVSGRRVERDLKKMFGDLEVDGVWLPYFAAACNLTKGCTTVQDTGPLWRAVLASNSPAGLFPPVLHEGQLLVDGAILENVPVQAMRTRLGTPLEQRHGNGTIIAIDVDVRDELGADPKLVRLSSWSTIKAYFSPTAPASPSIAEILYRAGHIGGLNQRSRTVAQSDFYLEPPVGAFSLMGYRHASEIATVGYQFAMEKIKLWDRQTLNH